MSTTNQSNHRHQCFQTQDWPLGVSVIIGWAFEPKKESYWWCWNVTFEWWGSDASWTVNFRGKLFFSLVLSCFMALVFQNTASFFSDLCENPGLLDDYVIFQTFWSLFFFYLSPLKSTGTVRMHIYSNFHYLDLKSSVCFFMKK